MRNATNIISGETTADSLWLSFLLAIAILVADVDLSFRFLLDGSLALKTGHQNKTLLQQSSAPLFFSLASDLWGPPVPNMCFISGEAQPLFHWHRVFFLDFLHTPNLASNRAGLFPMCRGLPSAVFPFPRFHFPALWRALPFLSPPLASYLDNFEHPQPASIFS